MSVIRVVEADGDLRARLLERGELLVTALLDVQHLLNLLPHRREILEIEGRERADLNPAPPLQFGGFLTAPGADLDVLLERQDVGPGQLASGAGRRAGNDIVHVVLIICCGAAPAMP